MPLCESLIDLQDPVQWHRAVEPVAHGYWHTWEALSAFSRGGERRAFLYVCEDTETGARAICPYAERDWQGTVDIYTPVGFSGFATNGSIPGLRDAWQAFASHRGYVCGYFALHPVLAAPECHVNVGSLNDLYLIRLGDEPCDALSSASQNVKRSIRRWERSGAEFVTDRSALVSFLLEHYAPFMESAGATDAAMWSPDFLQAICADPNVLMVGAADEQGICIVVTFGITPHCAEYQVNVSVRGGREFTAAMIWWGIRRLTAMKIPWLHLGGGVSRGDSLAQAKERYGPVCMPFMSAREIYDQDAYERLRAGAAEHSNAPTSFFPIYRAKPQKATRG